MASIDKTHAKVSLILWDVRLKIQLAVATGEGSESESSVARNALGAVGPNIAGAGQVSPSDVAAVTALTHALADALNKITTIEERYRAASTTGRLSGGDRIQGSSLDSSTPIPRPASGTTMPPGVALWPLAAASGPIRPQASASVPTSSESTQVAADKRHVTKKIKHTREVRPVTLEIKDRESTLEQRTQSSGQAYAFASEADKIDRLVRGSAAISAPTKVKAGDTFSVHLRVSPEALEPLLKDLKRDYPENDTLKGKQGIRLTSRMTAAVFGFGFEVFPKDKQVQAVAARDDTTWQWQIKALQSGQLTLNFTLSGALTIEGQEVTRNFYQYQQRVEVAVSPMGFIADYWQWLASSLAIPFVGALWAVFKKPAAAETKQQGSFINRLQVRRRRIYHPS